MDRLLGAVDGALRTLFARPQGSRPCPVVPADETHLGTEERRHAAALMRVNHVGEVCAQALYQGQALMSREAGVRDQLQQASREETEHLAWTGQRIAELGGRTSLLNPIWYGGSLAIGLVAGALGDRWNLGFLAETERQVEAHLSRHLDRLPNDDRKSRAIVAQMRTDEARHAETASALGAHPLPAPVRGAMKLASRLMTLTAYRV